ncbi:hypothetical protein [Dactylosporangium salmoneum]|uniref:Uncharacterized protein n=1 Tax=Dactylosporangium salmoneum TaxID=53361 RepID=A0ABN3G915_9ACTN
MGEPQRLGALIAVYATKAWHQPEGDPIVPDPRAPRPDCERHGCGLTCHGWTHTDACKRAFNADRHETWPAQTTGKEAGR